MLRTRPTAQPQLPQANAKLAHLAGLSTPEVEAAFARRAQA